MADFSTATRSYNQARSSYGIPDSIQIEAIGRSSRSIISSNPMNPMFLLNPSTSRMTGMSEMSIAAPTQPHLRHVRLTIPSHWSVFTMVMHDCQESGVLLHLLSSFRVHFSLNRSSVDAGNRSTWTKMMKHAPFDVRFSSS
jgi:hypothetical protein